ncbi:hypothetical protein UFOVP48_22 [uncultured Caudovirales phage]|uniref:Uncharacterized protein n=1 Tax=uncultured Caudovirales phage TaxID=2100421 RepID=A0A6J5KQG2_9CAUD|nr:hypothetical protein UFOVP48_22 [uncultured Caudovirales phage]
MYWQMFYIEEAEGKPMRLHLLSEVGDPGAGPGTSLGFVEQVVKKAPWNIGKRSDVTVFVHINATGAHAEVPDIETGMAIVLMNAKGTQDD